MGSCVSVHKDPESIMKLRFSIGSRNDKVLIPSLVKEKVNDGDRTVAVKSHSFPDAGSKDEGFFDSQPWLESDCEDDYYSVNGDFTPSRGNTPVHHKFSLGSLILNKEGTIGCVAEASDKKKRLSDLFKDSLRVDDEECPGNYLSRGSSGRQEKSFKSPQCCLPNLLSTERKRKTSPGNTQTCHVDNNQ